MTLATLNSWIRHATTAMKAGDCATAQQAVNQAWLALGDYSTALAQRRASPGPALAAHRTISRLLVKLGRTCGIHPDALLEPSGGRGGLNPDLLRPSGARTGTNPDLLRPSFAGPGDTIYNSLTTTLATLGIAGAVIGLGIGLYTVFHKT